MNSKLIFRLIGSSMEKNRHIRIPFFLVGIFSLMVFYIITSLGFSDYLVVDGHEVFYGAADITLILQIASGIIAIVAGILILYANVFIMKDRRREIGLYGILGLARKSVVLMLFYETLMNIVVCLGGGLLLGTLLNKLMLLTLYKLVGQPPVQGFLFSGVAFAFTLVLGLGVYLVCLIYNVASVRLSNPVELLRSNQMGEREPKVRWFALVIGLICTGAGYYLALTCRSTIDSIGIMFVAILLVIVGTYALFTTGTIAILKAIKNNKNRYYVTKNFVGVANLMYRMKHNAAGLASICVLSSGVILLISCVASLLALGRQNIDMMCPQDVVIRYTTEDTSAPSQVSDIVNGWDDVAVSNYGTVSFYPTHYIHTDDMEVGEFAYLDEDHMYDFNSWMPVYILTEEVYNAHATKPVDVNEGEVYVYDTRKKHYDQLTIAGETYPVGGTLELNAVRPVSDSTMALFNMLYIVVPDEDAALAMVDKEPNWTEDESGLICYQTAFDVDGKLTDEQMQQINNAFGFLGENVRVQIKQEYESFFMSLYGGTLFVGVFLALIFLMATVLIIYYKQMSEGFEDHHRYQIMKKVGLTEKEVRSSINRQVMILFFLPLVVASVHIGVASHIIRLFMNLIVYVEPVTFYLAIAGSIAVFALAYCFVYKLTSSQYFKIVDAAEHAA